MDQERIKGMEASFEKRLEEAANEHPDIKILLDSYNKIKTQEWSKDFLDGYMSCISDLIYVKRML